MRVTKANLWALGFLMAGALAATRMIGNETLIIAPWIALFFTQRYVRMTQGWQSLLLGSAAWALAYYVGWMGVLPLNGWKVTVVPVAVGVVAFIPFIIDRIVSPKLWAGLRWLVLPLAWVVTEALFGLAGVGTWGALAYSQYGFDLLLQGHAVFGLAWSAFVVAAVVSIANQLIDQRGRMPRSIGVFAGVLALALVLSGLRLAQPMAADASKVRVAGVVVDNLEAFDATWGPLSYGKVLDGEQLRAVTGKADALFDTLLARTDEAAAQGAKLIAWSEGNALVPATEENRLVARAQSVARERGVWIFAAMAVMHEGNPLAENVIVVIDDQGRIHDRYLKSHPTPGEASIKGDAKLSYVDTQYGRISWAICYDFDYTELLAQAGRAGVDILINPSWDSPGMTPLHSKMATFRSLENGAYMVRVVNDGLNIVSDPRGLSVFEQQTRRGQDALWTVDLPTKGTAAIYPWLQSAIGWIAGLALLALALAGYRRGRKAVLSAGGE
ncbi:nitrilase-related carbon-nitrogen hydrolase [uncultured Brevundimonas sp.]|uniref:nitrilase-related carbon-nitrogen hydrolase n=1 Tax=uncultured Brevundimonas sp. TaxID=213418 RepID=UPI00263570EF|nr:nitrilase-related carbon-nitrogen hydrolase [uncultured Brevundimonas sp.]